MIYETGHHNGIAELLEILGSIINGFALPIKAEHKRFLANVLVPLHRIADVTDFHAQLCYCVTQFVDKDPSLSSGVISGLLKTWPVVSSTKELLMVNELEELLELTPEEGFVSLIPRLFRRISLCLSSNHFQVAERTLLMWHNEYISGLIATHRAEILPIIYPALKGQSHWNATVNNLCMNVLKIFSDIDPDLVTMCAESYEKQIHEQSVQRTENAQAWIRLEKRCARII